MIVGGVYQLLVRNSDLCFVEGVRSVRVGVKCFFGAERAVFVVSVVLGKLLSRGKL